MENKGRISAQLSFAPDYSTGGQVECRQRFACGKACGEPLHYRRMNCPAATGMVRPPTNTFGTAPARRPARTCRSGLADAPQRPGGSRPASPVPTAPCMHQVADGAACGRSCRGIVRAVERHARTPRGLARLDDGVDELRSGPGEDFVQRGLHPQPAERLQRTQRNHAEGQPRADHLRLQRPRADRLVTGRTQCAIRPASSAVAELRIALPHLGVHTSLTGGSAKAHRNGARVQPQPDLLRRRAAWGGCPQPARRAKRGMARETAALLPR